LVFFLKRKVNQLRQQKKKTDTEKVYESCIFICSTCNQIRSCLCFENAEEITSCCEAGFKCEDPEMDIEEPDIITNDHSTTQDDQNMSNGTMSMDNFVEMDLFAALYSSVLKEKLNWYRLWNNIRFHIYII